MDIFNTSNLIRNIFNKSDFIIKSEPKRTIINEEEINIIFNKIGNGLKDELTEQEVTTLLDFIVEKTRMKLDRIIEQPLEDNPLHGLCGKTQYMSLKPLKNCKFDVTINNISDFTYNNIRHAFGTCLFNIKKENEVIQKRYLIDLTYRQFFTNSRCNKLTTEPDPGYFICNECKSESMLKWVKQLLEQGYADISNNEFTYYMKGFIYYAFYKENKRLPNIDEKIKLHNYCVEAHKLIEPNSQNKFYEDDIMYVKRNELNIEIPMQKTKRR